MQKLADMISEYTVLEHVASISAANVNLPSWVCQYLKPVNKLSVSGQQQHQTATAFGSLVSSSTDI